MEYDREGYVDVSTISSDTLLRWSSTIQPLPLPEHLTPRSGAPLRNVPDDVLLTVSPHIIAHVQRTAAQGGLQVISPRQVPFSRCMHRIPGGTRLLGDHVVGSIAEPDVAWPTIDDADMSFLLPDEPLPTPYDEPAVEPKTKTTPLTKADKLLSDPILSCLVKGRAVVDILRRDDVAGDGDAVISLLAMAWGVPVSALSELDAYTLGIDGPLLRHAIKTDDVYPMIYAPIHVRRCISTGASEATRALLPEDTAMDWKRSRVFCEAVYAMTMSIEGHKMSDMKCIPPPGDPGARTDRHGVMVFQPSPGSAWSFAPSTFSIYPVVPNRQIKMRGIPAEVLQALTQYVEEVRPVSHALMAGYRAATRKTYAVSAKPAPLETITDSYVLMVKSLMVGAARGKTAAATVRNVIYDAIEATPMDMRMKLARYICLAKDECRTHLKLAEVPDMVIARLATKFAMLGQKIRIAVVSEAARRGSTAEQWWSDILAQAPTRYHTFVEGSHGWARVALWLLFKGPTDKWRNLTVAVKTSTLRKAAMGSVGAMSLPAKKGSMERLLAATRHTVKEMSRIFGAYYVGVADVGLVIADQADEMGLGRTAQTLREAAYLWMLRARTYRGCNVVAVSHDTRESSIHHYRIRAEPVDLVLVPSPYRAYQAYVKHVQSSELISGEIKGHFREIVEPPISDVFTHLRRPILACGESILTKYLISPCQLGADMERAWQDLLVDITITSKMYGPDKEVEAPPSPKRAKLVVFHPREIKPPEPIKDDFYAMLAKLDPDTVDWVEDILENVPAVYSEHIMNARYQSPGEMVSAVAAIEHLENAPGQTVTEMVR